MLAVFPKGFLMYRVELKDYMGRKGKIRIAEVPNVPCGVESLME